MSFIQTSSTRLSPDSNEEDQVKVAVSVFIKQVLGPFSGVTPRRDKTFQQLRHNSTTLPLLLRLLMNPMTML